MDGINSDDERIEKSLRWTVMDTLHSVEDEERLLKV